MSPSELLQALSHCTTRDAVLSVVAFGLITHYIFRRWEPIQIAPVVTLLVVIPVALASLFVVRFGVLVSLILALAIYFATLGTSIFLYRISPFHPLARYPGPAVARVSALWIAYVASRGKRHLYIHSLHEKYGDVVRIGPNELSIRDASAISSFLGPAGMTKGPGMKGRVQHQALPLIAYPDPAQHAQRRRPWNRAFSTSALKEYQPIIAKRALQLLDALQTQGETVDLAQWISFFAYDFMGDMAYGGGTEMLRDGDKDGLWSLLKAGMRVAVIYEHVPWLSYYTRHLPGVGKDLVLLRAMTYERTDQRYHNGSSTKDLFFYLSNEDNAETHSPARHIVLADGILAVVAGSDTTATTICNIFFNMLCHPETYKRLQAEVDRYYPPGEDALDPINYVHMTYLDAVINEGMRLFPAIPSGSLRAPLAGSGGKVHGGLFIPEGTQARISTWAVQRDPRNFSNPTAFWPDRWLVAEGLISPPKNFVHNLNAFVPFSFGPANCVGKNLALLEMRMVICLCMQKLAMQFTAGWNPSDWMDKLEDVFVTGMGSLPVHIRRRD